MRFLKTSQVISRIGFRLFLLGSIIIAGVALQRNVSAALPVQADVRGQVEPAAVEAARQYLYGYANGNKTLLRRLMAEKLENYFGPCLFTQMPRITAIRVDGARAQADFEGAPTDPALPKLGTIVLKRIDLGDGKTWHIQGIFWRGDNTLSMTTLKMGRDLKDKRNVARVKETATLYITAWLKHDWATMKNLSYDWLSKRRPLDKEVVIRSLSTKQALRPDGSVRVTFTASVSPNGTLIKILRRTATGVLYLVKENGEWKIRGITTSVS